MRKLTRFLPVVAIGLLCAVLPRAIAQNSILPARRKTIGPTTATTLAACAIRRSRRSIARTSRT